MRISSLSTPLLFSFLFKDSKLSSGKTTFTLVFRVILWILVNIPQYFIAWRYRSQPVFWLPQGWFNGVMLWWLAFPFSPRGSVSVMTWTWACKSVLKIFEEVVRHIIRELLPKIFSVLFTDSQLALDYLVPVFISSPEAVGGTKTSEKQEEKTEPIPIAEVD